MIIQANMLRRETNNSWVETWVDYLSQYTKRAPEFREIDHASLSEIRIQDGENIKVAFMSTVFPSASSLKNLLRGWCRKCCLSVYRGVEVAWLFSRLGGGVRGMERVGGRSLSWLPLQVALARGGWRGWLNRQPGGGKLTTYEGTMA